MGDLAKWVTDLPWPAIVTLVLGSSLVTLVVGKLMDRGASAASARREGYARAARALVAWHEYPYRIRRRTSDDADTLAALANVGHDLQEELAAVHAWVVADAPWVAEVFANVRKGLDSKVGSCCKEAWEAGRVNGPAGMNLGGWGPAGADDALTSLHKAVAWRFGWRRLCPGSIAKERARRG